MLLISCNGASSVIIIYFYFSVYGITAHNNCIVSFFVPFRFLLLLRLERMNNRFACDGKILTDKY